MKLGKIVKSNIEQFKPQINKIITQHHGLLGRDLGKKILDNRFATKVLTNNNFKNSFDRLSWDGCKLNEYKFEKIKNLITYAYKYVPFYRNFYDSVGFSPSKLVGPEDLRKIPFIEKNKFKQAVIDKSIFSTEPVNWEFTVAETTGSTGVPTKVYLDKQSVSERSYALARAWFLNGILPSDPFIQIWRNKGLSRRDIQSLLFGNYLFLPVMDIMNIRESALNEDKIMKMLGEIEKFQPKYIRGYVSALHVLSKYYAKHKNKFNINPTKIIGSAEYLPTTIWDELEDVFDTKVINLYGGTEASPIAISTSHSRELVVFDDIFHVNLVDFNGENINSGVGSIALTDLNNYYMPIINYENGDMAEWGESKYLGFNTFKDVKGRKNDIFILPSNRILFADSWYIFFRDKLWLSKFKVTQLDINLINIQLEVNNQQDMNFQLEFSKLKNDVQQSMGSEININWEVVAKIPLDAGEKFRHVVSELDIDYLLGKI